MAFEHLEFTKNWERPEDFPTFEENEVQVRADMQLLHDEVKDFINDKLVEPLNSKSGADNILTSSGKSVEAVLAEHQAAINNGGGGGGTGSLYVFDDGQGNVTLGGVQEG